MNVQQLKAALAANKDQPVTMKLANGSKLAPHFHITEVGKVIKDFVDCGGTRRQTQTCMLQTWVANDTEHRLDTTKLASIMAMTSSLDMDESFEVEAEVQTDTIAIYSIENAQSENGTFVFHLVSKSTACLAPELCAIDTIPISIPHPAPELPVRNAPELPVTDGGCCGGSGGPGRSGGG